MVRRPVEKSADVALVFTTAVERVVTVEGETVLARLQVFEAVRDLRLPDPHAKLLTLIESDVRVGVAQLDEMRLARTRRSDRKVRLDIDGEMIAQLAKKNHAGTANQKRLIVTPGTVRVMPVGVEFIVEHFVVTELGIATQAQAVAPLPSGQAAARQRSLA